MAGWDVERFIRLRFCFRIVWLLDRIEGGVKRIVGISWSARVDERFHLSLVQFRRQTRHQAGGWPDAANHGFAALKNIKAALGKRGVLQASPNPTDRRGNAGGPCA